MESTLLANQAERKALDCAFAGVQRVFDDCLAYALILVLHLDSAQTTTIFPKNIQVYITPFL